MTAEEPSYRVEVPGDDNWSAEGLGVTEEAFHFLLTDVGNEGIPSPLVAQMDAIDTDHSCRGSLKVGPGRSAAGPERDFAPGQDWQLGDDDVTSRVDGFGLQNVCDPSRLSPLLCRQDLLEGNDIASGKRGFPDLPNDAVPTIPFLDVPGADGEILGIQHVGREGQGQQESRK